MSIPRPLLWLTTLCLLGCAGAPAPVSAPRAAEAEAGYEIHWVRDSAEYRAALVQTYRLAGLQLEELTRDLERGSWAVALDADETVISNLGYSLGRAGQEPRWTEETWTEWVRTKRATAIPGAIEFIDRVHRLGGRVAIVTNRSEGVCDATHENLVALGIRFDVLRCRADESSKESRWRAIEAGDGTGLGPLEIVMWIGDNIHDFPGLDQSARARGGDAYEEFGVRYFVLPNPLYGSWEPGR